MTTDFLVYATDMGDIVYFHVEEWAVAVEYKHTVGINKIFVDSAGSRLVFFDVKSQGYLFDAVITRSIYFAITFLWNCNLF